MSRLPFGLTLACALAATALAGEPSAVLNDFGGVQIAPVQPLPVRTPQSAEGAAARKKAVQWLLRQQHSDGGWSSGGFGTNGADAGSDVATSAFATLALHRDAAGSQTNADAVRKGVEFVVRAVETAPEGSRLNTPEGTQIQYKLGGLVDTHMAALALGEIGPSLSGSLGDRAKRALEVCVRKIERAQNADGSFDGNAWAPVLSSAVAAQGLSAAENIGIDVDDQVLARSDRYQSAPADASGTFDASAGAGVQLYAVASTLRGSSQALGRDGADAPSAETRREAEQAQKLALGTVAAAPEAMISGFGSVGGEEMLSYMMISDSLAEKGGAPFQTWDQKVGAFLASAQNADGSWVGHHCITSAAFATAGGILTLSAGDHAALEARRG